MSHESAGFDTEAAGAWAQPSGATGLFCLRPEVHRAEAHLVYSSGGAGPPILPADVDRVLLNAGNTPKNGRKVVAAVSKLQV